MNPQPVTNAHKSVPHRLNHRPDMSDLTNHKASHNFSLTQARDLDRYTPAISSKLNIYDQARVVEPMLVFGRRFIDFNGQRPRFSPAGMDMDCSRKITGLAFTKPVKKFYPQNL